MKIKKERILNDLKCCEKLLGDIEIVPEQKFDIALQIRKSQRNLHLCYGIITKLQKELMRYDFED